MKCKNFSRPGEYKSLSIFHVARRATNAQIAAYKYTCNAPIIIDLNSMSKIEFFFRLAYFFVALFFGVAYILAGNKCRVVVDWSCLFCRALSSSSPESSPGSMVCLPCRPTIFTTKTSNNFHFRK